MLNVGLYISLKGKKEEGAGEEMKQLSALDRPKQAIQPQELNVGEITSDNQYEDVIFQDGVVSGEVLEHVYFSRVHFKNVTFEAVVFERLELVDCVFDGCNVSNTEMIDAIIHRTAFNDAKLVGTNFSGSTFVGVSLTSCLADYSAFNDANLKRVLIQETSLIAAEMMNVTWDKWTLTSCRLDGLQLFHTSLKGLDVHTCQFETIAFTPELVKGFVIDSMQSVALVEQLGIKIKE